MTKKTVFKLLLDLSMTVLYLLLMFADGAGGFFHEVAGMVVGVLFAVHVLLNRQSLTGMLRARRKGAGSGKLSYMLLLDLLLTIGMPVVVATGALISQVLFDTGISDAWLTVFTIHNAASYVCLAVLALHLAAHAKYLAAAAGSAIRQHRSPNVKKAVGRFAAGTMAACFVYVLSFAVYKNSLGTALLQENIASVTEIKTESAAEDTNAADTSDDEKAKTGTADTPAATTAAVTLNEFLSKLYCTGCHNHCPLSSPRCGRSAAQIESATAEYYETYSVSAE